MKRILNKDWLVPGGEICAGCFSSRTNMWNVRKDVPVCDDCKNLKVKDLPTKEEWWKVIKNER